MTNRFDYKFVRLGEGFFEVTKSGKNEYQEEVDKYAAQGWRLVQIFATGVGSYGAAKYYELILEKAT